MRQEISSQRSEEIGRKIDSHSRTTKSIVRTVSAKKRWNSLEEMDVREAEEEHEEEHEAEHEEAHEEEHEDEDVHEDVHEVWVMNIFLAGI